MPGELYLVRHGETDWSRDGRHTGRTDVPLTAHGRHQAGLVGRYLGGHQFVLVLTSPLARAVETCRLARLGGVALERDDLREWDYGEYEGRTTSDIRKERPGWSLWRDGVPGGESVEAVGSRADAVIAEAREAGGDVALFAHGHLLRILAARWLGLSPRDGALLALDPATVSILGYEREQSVIRLWNDSAEGP